MYTLSIIFNLLLEQTEAQKKQTYIIIAILAFIGIALIMDANAKGDFVGDKTFKKVWLFFAFLFVFLFFILWITFKKS